MAGRQSPLALPQLGRPVPGTNPGRQSPLHHHHNPKVMNSPIVRRVKKSSTNSGPSNNLIRKSISMDNVAAANTSKLIVDTCEKYLDEKSHKSADVAVAEEEECAVTAQYDKVTNSESDSKGEIMKFNEVERVQDGNFSSSYGTLPRSISRNRNISRSLVPKMRKFFEKSRSCDPDLPQVKISLSTENQQHGSSNFRGTIADGTESARSSFVMLSPGEGVNSRSPSGSTMTLSDGGSDDRSRLHGKNKGFVNKCVTKVRSFMGKSQERE